MTLKVMNGMARLHSIHGLEADTVYEIEVVSMNNAGYSPESNTLRARTSSSSTQLQLQFHIGIHAFI